MTAPALRRPRHVPDPSASGSDDDRKYFGKYRGRVVNNVDPEGLGRLELQVDKFPGMKLNWALPSMPYAGRGVGVFAVPPEGACVWVEFEEGDRNFPVWTGCFWELEEGIPTVMLDPLLAPYRAILRMASIEIIVDNTPIELGGGGMSVSIGGLAVPVPITITANDTGVTVQVPPASVRITPELIEAQNEPGTITVSPETVEASLAETSLSLTEAEATLSLEPASVSLAGGMITVASDPSSVFVGAEGITMISSESTVALTAEAVNLNSGAGNVTISTEAVLLEIGSSNIAMAPVGLVVNDGALEVI